MRVQLSSVIFDSHGRLSPLPCAHAGRCHDRSPCAGGSRSRVGCGPNPTLANYGVHPTKFPHSRDDTVLLPRFKFDRALGPRSNGHTSEETDSHSTQQFSHTTVTHRMTYKLFIHKIHSHIHTSTHVSPTTHVPPPILRATRSIHVNKFTFTVFLCCGLYN